MILLVLGGAALASSDSTGTTPGNFLKLGGGARPVSMGGAFVGLADDINAVYWNPAGLTQNKAMSFTSMFNNYLAGITYTNLALTFGDPNMPLSTGLAIDYLSAGAIDETTAGAPTGTGKTFTPTAFSLTMPFAFQIIEPLSVGFNAKIMSDKISTGEAFGYGLDLGALWKITNEISVGFCARDLLGALMETHATLPQTTTALASNFALGMSYRLPSWKIALDYNQPNDNQGTINLGAEYSLSDIFYGRLGFSTRSEASAGGNMSAGLGLKVSIIKLDYAYTPYADLGASHRIAFSLVFPEGKPALVTAEAQTGTSEAKTKAPVPVQISKPATPEAPAIEKGPEVVVKKVVVTKKVTVVKKKPVKKPIKKPLPR